jgi:CBS domain containing-hemolysin-like protein
MSETGVAFVGGAAGLSQWQRVVCTFTAPSKTFEDIKRGNRSWWLPVILIAVFSYALFAVVLSRIGIQQVIDNQIHLNPQAEEKLAQATPEQRETSTRISVDITEGAFIASPFLTVGGIALMSLGLLGTINFVFGGKAKYGSVFAVWLYASLPGLIKALLGIVVIFAGTAPETFNIKNFAPTNVAAFVFPNPLEANKALYALASWLDFTTIWMLVLLGIGTATVAGIKRIDGYIAVFGWWTLFMLIGVGWAALVG